MNSKATWKRLLSLALCLVLCLSALPVNSVFADDMDDIASGYGWHIDDRGYLYISGNITNLSIGDDETPWVAYKDQIRAVITDPGSSVDNCSYLLANCPNLTYVDLKNLDISKADSANSMFLNDKNMTLLNLKGLDTANIDDMTLMFYGCGGLKELDVSGFNTSKVTTMSGMFAGCYGLTSLDVSMLDVTNVTDMGLMFYHCSDLVSLNLSDLAPVFLKNVSGIFSECYDLRDVTLNSYLLNDVAAELLKLHDIWVDKEHTQYYTTEAQLKSIRGTVTLSRGDMTCGGVPELCALSKFTDAPKFSNWAHEGIEFCVRRGLMSGTSAKTFEPKTSMTRAMLVTVLYRIEGEPGAGSSTFTDVKPTSWYGPAVSWAADKGIVAGTGGGKFEPNGNVTREQIATILYRYAAFRHVSTVNKASLNDFADGSKVGKWYVDAMQWAVAEGLINGSTSGSKVYLLPQGDATREQIAAILMRFINGVIG